MWEGSTELTGREALAVIFWRQIISGCRSVACSYMYYETYVELKAGSFARLLVAQRMASKIQSEDMGYKTSRNTPRGIRATLFKQNLH